jgi:hypothetical protein
MKKLIITEEEKNSLLNLHINEGYKTIMEQSEEILNTTHDKVWDYKKVGDEYYTKRKTSDKWIKTTGTALNAIKTKVKFEPTQQQDNTEQPTQQQDNTEQPTQQQDNTEQPTQQQDDTKPSRTIPCDTIVDAIAYKGGADVSLLTREKWFEYFGINLEDTKNNGIITALKQLRKDTEQGIKKGYVFKDLKLPINIKSKYYGLKEDGCCVYISRGNIYNYDPKLNKDDDIKSKAETEIRILIKDEHIKKVDC